MLSLPSPFKILPLRLILIFIFILFFRGSRENELAAALEEM